MERHVPPSARFGVVVCPGCRHARGVELKTKVTTCSRCGRSQRTRTLRVFHQTDDARELQAAIGDVEAQVAGHKVGHLEVQALEAERREQREARHVKNRPASRDDVADVIDHAASRAASVRAIGKKVDAILDALDAHGPEEGFTEEMVERAFEAAGIPRERAEKEIRRCIVQDALFEPRAGRLKRL